MLHRFTRRRHCARRRRSKMPKPGDRKIAKVAPNCTHPRAGASPRPTKPTPVPDSIAAQSRASRSSLLSIQAQRSRSVLGPYHRQILCMYVSSLTFALAFSRAPKLHLFSRSIGHKSNNNSRSYQRGRLVARTILSVVE